MIKSVETDAAPAPTGPYSQAVTCSSLLLISGQIGADPKTGRLVADDLERQLIQALANVTAILKAGGSDWNRVGLVEIRTTDLREIAVIDALYGEQVQGIVQPARRICEVSRLAHNARIEVSCVASTAK